MGEIKSSSHSAVDRAVQTIIYTYRMKSGGWDDTVMGQQNTSNCQIFTWQHGQFRKPRPSTKSPRSLNSAHPLGRDEPSVLGQNSGSCLHAGLLGAPQGCVTCTFVHTTIGFFELSSPRPYWTSSVYTRPVKQVMLLFCHFSFQTLLKCQDIRKQVRDRVFSLQFLRPTKACRGHRLHWRPSAVSLKWWSYAFKVWKGGVDKSEVKVKSTVFLSLLLAAFQRKENAPLEAGSLSCGSINNNFHLHRKIP